MGICERALATVRRTERRDTGDVQYWLDYGQPQLLSPYATRDEAQAAIGEARTECARVIAAAHAMEN